MKRIEIMKIKNFKISPCIVSHRFHIENLLHFSTSSSGKDSIKPVAIYPNSDTQKLEILRNNKNKSGIYR